MNARTPLAEPTVELIPIAALGPSRTHIQQLRRKRFNQEAITELAASLLKVGQLQPIVVRPHPENLPVWKYEIVLGERRFLACREAGLAHIQASVRELNDGEVLEAQLVENLQRQDLDPLEEAEGYSELRQLTGLDAKDIGDKVGKSRSWVYSRLALLTLDPAVRDALTNGDLDVSKALLIARFRSPKLQKKALDVLKYGRNWSVRRSAEALTRIMAPLDKAPFPLDDDRAITITLVRGEKVVHGACAGCLLNSANDRELTESLRNEHTGEDDNGPQCLERPCYEAKAERRSAELRAEHEAAGRTIVTGDAARAIVPSHGGLIGYADLDDEVDQDFPEPAPEDEESPEWKAWDERAAKWQSPTWRKLLGDSVNSADVILIESPRDKGTLIEALPAKAVRAILKAKKIKLDQWALPSSKSDEPEEERQSPAERRAEEEKREAAQKLEKAYRQRMFKAIYGKWKTPMKRQDMDLLAEEILTGWQTTEVAQLLGIGKVSISALRDEQLLRLMVSVQLYGDINDLNSKPGNLLAYCQRFKIDAKALRADPAAEKKPIKKK